MTDMQSMLRQIPLPTNEVSSIRLKRIDRKASFDPQLSQIPLDKGIELNGNMDWRRGACHSSHAEDYNRLLASAQ